jgi:hypothetical protein
MLTLEVSEMSAEVTRKERAPAVLAPVRSERRVPPAKGRVLRIPGPEALLHPRAAEALVLAFRPLSWSR